MTAHNAPQAVLGPSSDQYRCTACRQVTDKPSWSDATEAWTVDGYTTLNYAHLPVCPSCGATMRWEYKPGPGAIG